LLQAVTVKVLYAHDQRAFLEEVPNSMLTKINNSTIPKKEVKSNFDSKHYLLVDKKELMVVLV